METERKTEREKKGGNNGGNNDAEQQEAEEEEDESQRHLRSIAAFLAEYAAAPSVLARARPYFDYRIGSELLSVVIWVLQATVRGGGCSSVCHRVDCVKR